MRVLGLAIGIFVWGADAALPQEPGRCADYSALRSPYFGDLHVHTRYSLDASTQGTRSTPEQAYRFARGERIGLQPWDAQGRPGRFAQLPRPLDFAAVTDHAELFGEVAICTDPDLEGYDAFVCWLYRGWPRLAFFAMSARGSPRFGFCGPQGRACLDAARGPWREMREAAQLTNDGPPSCAFTSLIGYEWTKSIDTEESRANNLHRNVIFSSSVVPDVPASSTEYPTPEALWKSLDENCRRDLPGCEALAIPHNSNISGGFMFQPRQSDGSPMTETHARWRAHNEPLVEVMQHKGDSECAFGPTSQDELCGFEALPYDNFMGRFAEFTRKAPASISFTRTAQGVGLVQRAAVGANPFKFGLIASTDTHLGAPGLVQESRPYGHGGAGIPIGEVLPRGLLDPIEYNPGGLAVVWAEENTRRAIFAALQRKETYGTSGPRIVFRLFGGWDLGEEMCGDGFAERGYASGVPMGADLPPRPEDRTAAAPMLAAFAARDPGTADEPGVPLQRMQIIKVWEQNGQARDRVYDVAGDPQSSALVDPSTCQRLGEGFDQLCAVWRDPDFDPQHNALYYGRVVENPSCRWSTWACNAAGVDCADPSSIGRGFEPCCDPEYPQAVQERAWTSPIWYSAP